MSGDPDPRPPGGLSSGAKWALAVVGVVIVVVAFLVLRGGDDDGGGDGATVATAPARTATSAGTTARRTTPATPAAPPVATITVVDGRPRGGVQRITRSKGDRIRLLIVSDTADEIHVHGYDLKKDVAAGGSVRFSFPATIDGRFVVELEGSGTQLAELDVRP